MLNSQNSDTLLLLMKILNLYAGIGGNRLYWGDDHTITAVEYDERIAEVYSRNFSNDTVVVADAHKYLIENAHNFDFIWSSPPCQTHSRIRKLGCNRVWGKVNPIYPDMTLYQEILFLQHYYKGKWVVENTIPFYKPLVDGYITGQHLWWSNFDIDAIKVTTRGHFESIAELERLKGFDLSIYNLSNKTQILRNCVEPTTGLHVFNNMLSSLPTRSK